MEKRQRDFIATIEASHNTIRKKPFLSRLYADFYEEIRLAMPARVDGPVVELGSGAGFFKNHLSQVITGDVLPSRFIDVCFDARSMPFRENSLKGIVMLNVFHHIPSAGVFLADAQRCLQRGGVVVMIEPWITAWSLLIYKLLHHEATDPSQRGWDFESSGPLSGANQALPWIFFQRDRVLFERTFSNLRIETIRLHTPLRYLASGGLSHQATAPMSWYAPLVRMENRAQPLRGVFSMFATIILKRTE
jgi:SAM-dependent methyltransferase